VWVNAKWKQGRVTATYTPNLFGGQTADADSSSSAVVAIALRDSLARTAREEKYLDLYVSWYLCSGLHVPSKGSISPAAGWLVNLKVLLGDAEKTFRYAVLATSTTMLGCRDGDNQLRVKGLQVYTVALKALAKVLNNAAPTTSVSVIAAIRLMGSYEVLQSGICLTLREWPLRLLISPV
jgi:hypothetical protein